MGGLRARTRAMIRHHKQPDTGHDKVHCKSLSGSVREPFRVKLPIFDGLCHGNPSRRRGPQNPFN